MALTKLLAYRVAIVEESDNSYFQTTIIKVLEGTNCHGGLNHSNDKPAFVSKHLDPSDHLSISLRPKIVKGSIYKRMEKKGT